MKMTAVIVDDEEKSRTTLAWLLEKYCPTVTLSGSASNIEEGLRCIETIQPDLLFLDINLTQGTGFDLLKRLEKHNMRIIFVTAYAEYALKAFEFSAVHYLLKPVNVEKLLEAVSRALERSPSVQQNDSYQLLLEMMDTRSQLKKIMVPVQDGFELIDSEQILYFEADGSYTRIFMQNRSLLATKLLKDFEDLLDGQSFFRIHRTYLVNLKQVCKYTKGRGGLVTLSNGTQLEVSRYKKEALLQCLRPE